MATPMKIDFVSDVSCPWCAIGLNALELAIAQLGDAVTTEIHFQPFELNPQMPAEGQDITEHLAQKYGATPEQSERTREMIRARGEEVGFSFALDKRSRIYNTFDAHRLLHWAEQEGRQLALKHALFKAYFSDGENPGAHEVLIRVAGAAGLDAGRAREILSTNAYAEEVRKQQRYYLEHGINAVPAVIVNDRHLIQGGQPAKVFEQALRQIAADS
jgi:predicted DsbA family dithiol-disulfide isomerase